MAWSMPSATTPADVADLAGGAWAGACAAPVRASSRLAATSRDAIARFLRLRRRGMATSSSERAGLGAARSAPIVIQPAREPDKRASRAIVLPDERARRPRQPPGRREQPLPPAAPPQPGRLVSLGHRGDRAGAPRGQADLPLGGRRDLLLVSRHGARVVLRSAH